MHAHQSACELIVAHAVLLSCWEPGCAPGCGWLAAPFIPAGNRPLGSGDIALGVGPFLPRDVPLEALAVAQIPEGIGTAGRHLGAEIGVVGGFDGVAGGFVGHCASPLGFAAESPPVGAPRGALALAFDLEPAGFRCLEDFVAAETGGGLRVGLAAGALDLADLLQVSIDDDVELGGGGRLLDGDEVGCLHCFSLLFWPPARPAASRLQSYRLRAWSTIVFCSRFGRIDRHRLLRLLNCRCSYPRRGACHQGARSSGPPQWAAVLMSPDTRRQIRARGRRIRPRVPRAAPTRA